MLVKPKSTFPTVTSEGELLPPDLLARIQAGDASVAGLTPGDYHLPAGMWLNEAINRSWSALQGAWVAFDGARAQLAEDDPGTTLTRERWLLHLFQELGYAFARAGGCAMGCLAPRTITGSFCALSTGCSFLVFYQLTSKSRSKGRSWGYTNLIYTLPKGTAYCLGIVLMVMMTGRLVQCQGSLARAVFPLVSHLKWGWHRVERALERGKLCLDSLSDQGYDGTPAKRWGRTPLGWCSEGFNVKGCHFLSSSLRMPITTVTTPLPLFVFDK